MKFTITPSGHDVDPECIAELVEPRAAPEPTGESDMPEESYEVNERWRLRNGSYAIVSQRNGKLCVGHIEGSQQVYCWVNGKTQAGTGYDFIELGKGRSMKAKTQQIKAAQASDILTVLAELNRGKFMIECGRQLQVGTDSVIRTGGKSAKLTITLDIRGASIKDGRVNAVDVSPTIVLKEAQPNQGKSLFFVSEEGNLTRDDPDQTEMFAEEENTDGR